MRYINQIFAPRWGDEWTNQRLLARYQPYVDRLEVTDAERQSLHDFLRLQLIGERSRYYVIDEFPDFPTFHSRAHGFETQTDAAVDKLAESIRPAAEAAGITFDAVIGTTATGNLMPGISYRMANRLGPLVRRESPLIDLANVGCTGTSKALNLARSLDDSFRNILIVAVEVPSTLAHTATTDLSTWQAHCTFGDGTVAVWVSSNPDQGATALAIEQVHYRQSASDGLEMIRYAYGDYYYFALGDHGAFDASVRGYVVDALTEFESSWKPDPRWAIHPAGIVLLVRISRRLGIPSEALQPSAAHYRKFSNMSSVSLFHILDDVSRTTDPGDGINFLTMGAGFNVLYGKVRKLR
jgi:alkylresorcinol/alkylpyrone synthase